MNTTSTKTDILPARTTSKTTRRSAAPGVAFVSPLGVPVDPGAPLPVTFDMRVTSESIVKIATVRRQEQLVLERDAVEKELKGVATEYEETQKRLSKLGGDVIGDYRFDPTVNPLLEALQGFTGRVHIAQLVSNNWSRYSINSENREPEIDIEKQMIQGTIRIVERPASGGTADRADAVVEKAVEIPFTAAMKKAVTAIEEAAKAVAGISEKLTDVKRKIADLPRLKDRAEAALTEAYLRGQITDASKMLDAVMGTESKALPASFD